MSTPGQDNLSKKQRRELNRQMQQASAAGNKSVQSASSSVEPPQLRSVNEEPQYNIPAPSTAAPQQILSNEQIVANREQYKKENPNATLATPAPKEEGFTPIEYKREAFNVEAANKAADSNVTLQDIIAQANKETQAAKERAQQASHSAKMNAWGNLFSALGNLAGAGKNTYVKPESKYLSDAMAKAQQARDFYDKINAANEQKKLQARQGFIDKLEQQHWTAEKLREEGIKNYNTVAQKAYAEERKAKLQAEQQAVDADYKAKQISVAEYNAKTSRLNQQTNEIEAQIKQGQLELSEAKHNFEMFKDENKAKTDAVVRFEDNGTGYNIDTPKALEIAQYLMDKKGYTEQQLGIDKKYGDTSKGTISNPAKLSTAIQGFLKGNANDADVRKMLEGVRTYQYSATDPIKLLESNPELAKSKEFKDYLEKMGFVKKEANTETANSTTTPKYDW